MIRPMNEKYPPLKKNAMAPWRIKNAQQDKAFSRRQFIWTWIERLIIEGKCESESVEAVTEEIGADSIFTKVDRLRKAAKIQS